MTSCCLIAILFLWLTTIFKHGMYNSIRISNARDCLAVSHFIFPLIHKVLDPCGWNTGSSSSRFSLISRASTPIWTKLKNSDHLQIPHLDNFALHSNTICLRNAFRVACLASVCNTMETVTYGKCLVLSPQLVWVVVCFESSSPCRALFLLFWMQPSK